MNRRRFLQVGGVGLLTIAGGSMLTSLSGIERIDPAEGQSDNRFPREIKEIFALATLAPSGHNTQPWLVKPTGTDRFRISLSKKCLLPAVDPVNREAVLSIGAFLQNLTLAAGNMGYLAEIATIGTDTFSGDLVEVQFKKERVTRYKMERLRGRRTVRNGYIPDELRQSDLSFITNRDTLNIHYFSARSREGKFLSEGTIEANRIQAYRNVAQSELADWIRWSPAEAKEKMDGLTPESMEIGGFAGWFVRNFYDRESVLEPGFREKTVDKTIDQVNNCGGWLVITSPDMKLDTLLATGRRFEDMFLRIRERMIGIHPMTQLLEEGKFKSRVASELGLAGSEVQFILRTGYLESYPDPVSLRRPLNKIFTTNS